MQYETHPKFSSPEEEIQYLRREIEEREAFLREKGNTESLPQAVEATAKRYIQASPSEVLTPEFALSPEALGAITLDLPPEKDDAYMGELLGVMQEKGIKNALAVVEALNNPHLTDDFHRVLIAFLAEGHTVSGFNEETPLGNALGMVLYEMTFPTTAPEGADVHFKELIKRMEQWYAGMLSEGGAHDQQYADFTIEVAVADGTQEIIFYVGVPRARAGLFEKQATSLFPEAHIREEKSDYNIFVPGGVPLASRASLAMLPVFPLQTYEGLESDPLTVLLNAFSKVEKHGAGAAIQFVFHRPGTDYIDKYQQVIGKVEKGEKVKDAYRAVLAPVFDMFHSIGHSLLHGSDEVSDLATKDIATDTVALLKKKVESPIVLVNLQAVASASTKARSAEMLRDIESAFGQFSIPSGNSIRWTRAESGNTLRTLLNAFTFRQFSEADALPLSYREVASLVHFPPKEAFLSPAFKQAKAGSAAPPLGLATYGTVLGVNHFRGVETKVYVTPEDRLRHFYVIGQTGTGKTTLLKNMIVQDIEAGNGVCFIDPHGSDVMDVLAAVPKERRGDVIYFDPAYTERVMGLNMLEFDPRYPEQKTFVVNELFSIFKKLYGAVPESMGPAFEQYFRNATLLVLEDPESGMTLLDVSRVLADAKYRAAKLSKCKNPVVLQFWQDIASKAQGEASLANIVPYITNKFDIFTANEYMRPIIAQEHSAFRFREIMDEKKILLVNLSKGRLGDINANLIGLILVGKILMAALSRVDSFSGNGGSTLPPFYLYIDEFQNITTNSIATILSEARKYNLALTIAHQFIAQLDTDISNAVFGNVGSLAAFRVGPDDATFLEKQFAPVFTPQDLMNIDNRNAHLRILTDGKPMTPFNIQTLSPRVGDMGQVEMLRQESYSRFGRKRSDVEVEIQNRFKKEIAPPPFIEKERLG